MRIPAMTMDSPLMRLSRTLGEEKVEQYDAVAAEASVTIRGAEIDYYGKHDPTYPGRPYLHFIGDCHELTGDFAHNAKELPFYEEGNIPVDIRYNFSDDEIATMVKQGLFRDGFAVPSDFIGATITVPVTCSLSVVTPSKEDSVPLFFASIKNSHALTMDSEHSDWAFGYEFDALKVKDIQKENDDDLYMSMKNFITKEEEALQEEKPNVEESVITPAAPKVLSDLSVDELYDRVKAREARIEEAYQKEREEIAKQEKALEETVDEDRNLSTEESETVDFPFYYDSTTDAPYDFVPMTKEEQEADRKVFLAERGETEESMAEKNEAFFDDSDAFEPVSGENVEEKLEAKEEAEDEEEKARRVPDVSALLSAQKDHEFGE